jgi:hypothetical protein
MKLKALSSDEAPLTLGLINRVFFKKETLLYKRPLFQEFALLPWIFVFHFIISQTPLIKNFPWESYRV